MKLSKISYQSAVFFAAITLFSTLIAGLIVTAFPQVSTQIGMPATTYLAVLAGSVTQTIGVYVGVIFSIAIYNLVAKRYPISWETKK